MKSKIYLDEVVDNTERRFGSAQEYFPIMVHDTKGYAVAAMFTENEILKAVERAKKNAEDLPENDPWFESFD